VRKALGIEFEGFAFPDRTMTLSIDYDFSRHRDYSYRNYILDPVEWGNLFKWPDVWRVVLPADPNADPDTLLEDEVVQAAMQRFQPIDGAYTIVSKSLYTVHQRVAKTFNIGRALLAGDAAHVNSPIGAMGMNSGIHDAANLGDKLADAIEGKGSTDGLDLYTRQRRHAAVAHIQSLTIRNKRLMAESDPVIRKQHHAALRRCADDPAEARDFLLKATLIQSIREAAAID
jgi:3-(3-hydroxy-phenyl)propionate hydroxylase